MARIVNKNTGKVLVERNSEKQELHCHECNQYVQFPIDLSMNGNHVLDCPNCGHEHCRVVKDGRITSSRWDSRNGNTYTISTYSLTDSTAITSTYISTDWGTTGTTYTTATW